MRSPKSKLQLCNKRFISKAFSRNDKRLSNLQLQVCDQELRQNGANGFNYRLKTTSKKSMGAQVGAKISLSQVVAVLIDRWDSLAESVKVEIGELLGDG